MGKTSIEWVSRSWNPIRGTKGRHICQRISDGCKNCYAATMNRRFSGIDYVAGADVPRLDHKALLEPTRWRNPETVFPCSMTDLWWDQVPDVWVAQVFAVMALTPRHTYRLLTKRADRMKRYLKGRDSWSPPNVWLGVSVEDQATADERIPLLLQTPAAVRWVSYEPALELVDFRAVPYMPGDDSDYLGAVLGNHVTGTGIDWIVVGGESGPGARPFDLAWARSTVAQCKAAGVPVFVKQLGAKPRQRAHNGTGGWLKLRDRKGGSMEEWPKDLRVRQYPSVATSSNAAHRI